MKRHILGLSMTIVSLLLGWFFLSLGGDWLLIYAVFGGVLIMALFALLDGKARGGERGQ